MKHTPKPDGTRWMMRNGQISGPLKETGYPEWEYPLTDGRHRWTLDGHFNASRSQHPFDLLYPVTVTPLPDPEPEEPKELWANVHVVAGGDLSWMTFDTEAKADEYWRFCGGSNIRLTGHAIRYVLPDEAERGFSEEEERVAFRAYATSFWGYVPDERDNVGGLALKAALSAISQHRSKKPS